MHSKGQTSFEYMAIVAIVLVLLVPISAYVYQQSETSNRAKQAEIAVNSIAAAADALYSQGESAKTTLNVNLPAGYLPKESYIKNGIVSITYTTPLGKQSIASHPRANITGGFSSGFGFKAFTLKVISGQVNISG